MNDLNNDSTINLKKTTPEFRNGFISAMRCILDMRNGSHTYDSLLNVVESVIKIHEMGFFFPEEKEMNE